MRRQIFQNDTYDDSRMKEMSDEKMRKNKDNRDCVRDFSLVLLLHSLLTVINESLLIISVKRSNC